MSKNEITEPTGEDLARAAAEVLSELITVPVEYSPRFNAGVGRAELTVFGLRNAPEQKRCPECGQPIPRQFEPISLLALRNTEARTFVRTVCMDQLQGIAAQINSDGSPVTTYDLEVPRGLYAVGHAEHKGIATRCVIGYLIELDAFVIRFDVLYGAKEQLAAAA